jgi:putative transposase
MRKSRYTKQEILGILKRHETGIKVADLCREHSVSEATFYNWKSKYGRADMGEIQRLRLVEDENRRLKQLVANLSLDCEPRKQSSEKKG